MGCRHLGGTIAGVDGCRSVPHQTRSQSAHERPAAGALRARSRVLGAVGHEKSGALAPMPLARSRTRLGLTSRKSLIRLARELLCTSSAVMLTIAARDAKRPVVSPFSPLRFLAETARWNRSRSSRTCVVWAGLPLLSSSRSPPNGPGSPRNLRRSWPVATVALAQPLDRQVSSGGRVGHRRSPS